MRFRRELAERLVRAIDSLFYALHALRNALHQGLDGRRRQFRGYLRGRRLGTGTTAGIGEERRGKVEAVGENRGEKEGNRGNVIRDEGKQTTTKRFARRTLRITAGHRSNGQNREYFWQKFDSKRFHDHFGTQIGQRVNCVSLRGRFHRMEASANQISLLIARQNLEIPAQRADSRLAVDLQVMKRLFHPQEIPTWYLFHVSTFLRSSSARCTRSPRKTRAPRSTSDSISTIARWRAAADKCSQGPQNRGINRGQPPTGRTARWRNSRTPTAIRPPRGSCRNRRGRRLAAV